jgi:osmotically-inducible protein OsmY
VHAQVKARLAENKKVDGDHINVDVSSGDVTLRGTVSSREEASEAIRTALNTQGVDRVTSYLTWTPSPMP